MSNIKFEISIAKNDSSYRYKKYEDGKLVKQGAANHSSWDTDEEKKAWDDAVVKFNNKNKIKMPSDISAEQANTIVEMFGLSSLNMDSPVSLDLINIITAVASLQTDPENALGNIITACRKGPSQIKDVLMHAIKAAKANLFGQIKDKAQNYETIMKAYLAPVQSAISQFDNYKKQYDAAIPAWRIKYNEEINYAKMLMSEGETAAVSNLSSVVTQSNNVSKSNNVTGTNTKSESTEILAFTPISNIEYYKSNIPVDIQRQANDMYMKKFGLADALPAEIKKRYDAYKNTYFITPFHSAGTPIAMHVMAIIESNCMADPGAGENSNTARGMWQFTRPVGAQYELLKGKWIGKDESSDPHNFVITSKYDYRKDPLKSSNAAAKRLNDIHNKYSFCWLLTAAAYNCGTDEVKELQDKYGKDPWKVLPHLNENTRNYCLVLIKLIQVLEYKTDFLTE